MKKLPEIWYLEFETREMFNELCLPYQPNYNFYPGIGMTNKPTNIKLGKYYYNERDKERYGEEITYEQFKQFTTKIKKEDLSYLKRLFKKLNIQ